jgi:hypothetical protein
VHIVNVEGTSTGKTNGLQTSDIIMCIASDKDLENPYKGSGLGYKHDVEKLFKKADKLECNLILFIRRVSL